MSRKYCKGLQLDLLSWRLGSVWLLWSKQQRLCNQNYLFYVRREWAQKAPPTDKCLYVVKKKKNGVWVLETWAYFR